MDNCTNREMKPLRFLQVKFTTTKKHTNNRKVKFNNPQISLRCIQINLQHSTVATDNLMNLIQQDHTDILFIQVSCSRHLRLMDVARQKLEFQKLRDFPFTLFCSWPSLADWLVCEWGEIGGGCRTRFCVWSLCLLRGLVFVFPKR
jgi:hypothetical protein